MSRDHHTISRNNRDRKSSSHAGVFHGAPGRPSRGNGQKVKDVKGAWSQLISYCKPFLAAIIIAILLALTGTIFNIIAPNQIGAITDEITKGLMGTIDIEAIKGLAFLLIILYGLSAVFSYIQSFIMATVTQKITKGLRTDISQKINNLPLKYFDSRSFGDVLSRVTNDIDMIGTSLNQSIVTLVTALALLIGSLVMMVITNWILALAAVGASIIGFISMMAIMGKSQQYFIKQQKSLGEINGHIEEVYAGHNVVKVLGGSRSVKETFATINNELYDSAWKSQFLSGLMMPLMGFVGNLGFVVVCVVGGALCIDGKISFGTITSFMLYIRLFTQPLTQIAQAATSLQSTAAASERVFEFLGEEELADESHKTKKINKPIGNVEFEHVTFGYDEDRMIIKDFSIQVKAGQKIAIVGPTGAGKTTIVNLLMGFYEINSGSIKIDGMPIDELTRENIHELFGMVLQDTWLFEGTIKENILYGKHDISDEQLVQLGKVVGLHHFIKTLPKGYDTILDDKANLSAGQRQLITIARAMAKNAPMLILDEATSSVDTRTEILIQKAMDKLMEGRTSFIIAHRLSTIKNADVILVMSDGGIKEWGNHEELLKINGYYATLYNSQFEQG